MRFEKNPMADVINLRRARKHRERCKEQDKAQENRALYGQKKSLRAITQARILLQDKQLDASLRESSSDTRRD
ncbi:MAG: DUF4169 family protein [Methylocystaceae bacterium]|nr:DUF4169 family protein [Methylocystaceae bacterium]